MQHNCVPFKIRLIVVFYRLVVPKMVVCVGNGKWSIAGLWIALGPVFKEAPLSGMSSFRHSTVPQFFSHLLQSVNLGEIREKTTTVKGWAEEGPSGIERERDSSAWMPVRVFQEDPPFFIGKDLSVGRTFGSDECGISQTAHGRESCRLLFQVGSSTRNSEGYQWSIGVIKFGNYSYRQFCGTMQYFWNINELHFTTA